MTNCQRLIIASFHVLTSLTAVDSLKSFIIYGKYRCHFIRIRDKEASCGLELRSKAMTLCVYVVTSLISQSEIRNFAEKREKRVGISTTHHSQMYSKSPHTRTYCIESQAEIGSYFKGTKTDFKV